MEDPDKVLFDSFVASGTPYREEAFRLSLQSNLLYDDDNLRDFLASAHRRNLRIAVITSGGTIAPLEKSCVRFIDNFSTGTRGATATEFFLRHKDQDGGQYAVIFLHRKGSVLPFTRHVNVHKLAESCELNAAGNVVLNDDGVQEDLRNLISVKDRWLAIPFVSVSDYLLTLRSLSSSIAKFGNSVLLFLAAAVSDFYIPYGDLPTHKLQSGSGDLVLRLQKVPKMLGIISQQWVPNAFVVSFKVSFSTFAAPSPHSWVKAIETNRLLPCAMSA